VKTAVKGALLFLLTAPNALGASQEELLREIEFLKKRLAEVERELKESRKGNGAPKVSFGGDATLYYQGARWGSKGPTGAGFTANLELSAEPVEGGELYARIHAGEGEGADEELAEHLFANLNTLADDNPESGSVKILDLFYRQELSGGKLTLFIGKTEPFILIDSNEFAGDETSQFVGKAFVNNPIIDSEARFAPAAAFDLKASEALSLQGFIQSSDKGELQWNGQEWENKEKSPYSDPFDHPTLAIQTTYSREGENYRLYFWTDTAPHPKVNQVEEESKKPDEVKGIVVGLSFDQKLSERFGLFGRASVGRKSAYAFWQFYSLGFNLLSPFKSREKDSLALGVAAIVPSPLYSKQSTEVHLEGYYRYRFSEKGALTPDFQVVLNPAGDGEADPIYALTVRLEVSF